MAFFSPLFAYLMGLSLVAVFVRLGVSRSGQDLEGFGTLLGKDRFFVLEPGEARKGVALCNDRLTYRSQAQGGPAGSIHSPQPKPTSFRLRTGLRFFGGCRPRKISLSSDRSAKPARRGDSPAPGDPRRDPAYSMGTAKRAINAATSPRFLLSLCSTSIDSFTTHSSSLNASIRGAIAGSAFESTWWRDIGAILIDGDSLS